jgi:hypothetical protein
MKTEKFYWLVMPDSYHIMNKTIGSRYTDEAIEKFKLNYKNGLCVTFESTPYSEELKTSHIQYEKVVSGSSFEMWLSGYKYMGELSRRSKLKKLNTL